MTIKAKAKKPPIDSNKKNQHKPKGGHRMNAGRKPGPATMKTREVADRIAQSGQSPLEIMFYVMNEHVERSKVLKKQIEEDNFYDEGDSKEKIIATFYGSLSAAATVAKDCAPYIHAKIQPVEKKSGEDSRQFNLSYTPEQIQQAARDNEERRQAEKVAQIESINGTTKN
jgi:hypothetical protein